MHIGVLDDNANIREYLTTALRLKGYTATAHDTKLSLLDALFHADEVITPLPYDLLIIDIFLSGNMTGMDTFLFIRRTIPAERLPIILITASREHIIDTFRMNFPDVPFLFKPFSLTELFQTITRCLEAPRRC
jgi:CheY-like chemotaxis protein